MLFIIVLLLLMIVVVLGGGNILIGLSAFPVLFVLSFYLWGSTGFVTSIIFLFLLAALPIITALVVLLYRSLNKEKSSICDLCNEKDERRPSLSKMQRTAATSVHTHHHAEPLQPGNPG